MDPIDWVHYGSNNTNASLSQLPQLEALGPPYQLFLAVLYSVTAIFTFILNFIAATFLIVNKRSSADLRKHLINLAFADILMAIFSIPFSYTDFMYGRWIFPLFLCPITQFIQVCAVCISIYTLIAIGIERYFAIVYPLRSHHWFETQTNFTIILIWVLSIGIGSPLLFESRAIPFRYGNEDYHDCREKWEGEMGGKIYTAIIFIMTFAVPFLALSFLYTSIGIKTFKHIIPGNANSARDEAQLRTKIKVVKMLVILVISFAICWMPLQIFNLLMWLCDDLRHLETSNQYYFYVISYFSCHFLSTIHSLIDPLIYCFMSKNFKFEEMRAIFCFNRRRNRITTEGISQTQSSNCQIRSITQLNCSTYM